jgi:hypothetical protein
MKRAKLKYSIAQNKKGNHTMLYNVLTCKDSWLYVKYFKLDKQKQMLNELEKKDKE